MLGFVKCDWCTNEQDWIRKNVVVTDRPRGWFSHHVCPYNIRKRPRGGRAIHQAKLQKVDTKLLLDIFPWV